MGYEPKLIPKTVENYVSVQVDCFRFLDSHRFLSSSLDKLVICLYSFPIVEENCLDDEFLQKKLAYPYEYFNLDNFQEPYNFNL